LKFSSYKLHMKVYDIIIIGAGIAGVSVAARLAPHKNVCVLDMEERAGVHSTGRSAAMYVPNYGPAPILALTRASFNFFKSPGPEFSDTALISPRGTLMLEPEGQEDATNDLLTYGVGLEQLTGEQAIRLCPALRPGYAKRALLDPHTYDIDVDILHRSFVKMMRSRGGTLMTTAMVTAIKREGSDWRVTAGTDQIEAPTIVNAAGAWGDAIAMLAGVRPVGLTPKRRSIGVIPVPERPDIMQWPMLMDTAETWYAKPQSGKLLVSSADETPVEPHDAYADDMAIAEGVESLIQATTLEVDRLDHSWGGLRTFAPDGNPAVGFDPHTEGFFWLVGQGGYGIQTSPALSETAAAMVLGKPVPSYVMEQKLIQSDIEPQRLLKP
jgi:D-arginine dehydrogenase